MANAMAMIRACMERQQGIPVYSASTERAMEAESSPPEAGHGLIRTRCHNQRHDGTRAQHRQFNLSITTFSSDTVREVPADDVFAMNTSR